MTTLAGRLGVNVADVEIAHSTEGREGVLVLIVAADDSDGFAPHRSSERYQFSHLRQKQ